MLQIKLYHSLKLNCTQKISVFCRGSLWKMQVRFESSFNQAALYKEQLSWDVHRWGFQDFVVVVSSTCILMRLFTLSCQYLYSSAAMSSAKADTRFSFQSDSEPFGTYAFPSFWHRREWLCMLFPTCVCSPCWNDILPQESGSITPWEFSLVRA